TKTIPAEIWRGKLGEGIDVFFIGRDEFFDRTYLYGTPRGDYFDNAYRFAYFCRAVMALAPAVKYQPHLVHCHDWQSGLVPAYLRLLHARDPFWAQTASMFTIHNIAYQGQFAADVFAATGLPGRFFAMEGMEFWGGVNYMKAGIVCADVITTVSPRYSDEIRIAPAGYGLEGVLRANAHKLHGIINGADYREWNPETDSFIAANYSEKNLAGKKKCKRDLLAAAGLPARLMARPLLGVVSRLADQKGLDLIAAVVERAVAADLGLVILGTGDERYHELFSQFASRHPEHVAVHLDFDNRLAHKIEAGADMFLMPSRYEPCGLNQMYSLRYGTVPIVRATGGLYDTVKPFDPERGEGVGFCFSGYEAKAFWDAIQRAVATFEQQAMWRRLMRNAMAMDFSWKNSARQYLALYEKVVAERRQEPVR
ncbi:MAG TPA: glycogen/starch synthase, partial [Syntrophobacteria bacterium]|nr:glycogen/starch synthase [Syntrophobacteria bacterium]